MSSTPDFAVEHTAINVPNAVEMAAWYCKHLNMSIIRKAAFDTHFLSDATGRVVLEVYTNTALPVLDFPSLHPSALHLAMTVNNVKQVRDSLVGAGATVDQDILTTEAGDEMLMLKDPWGVTLQIIKRAHPMLH